MAIGHFEKGRRRKGAQLAPRSIKELLPRALKKLEIKVGQKPQEVVASWKEIVGDRLAGMTRATRFESGILHVEVSHSTLYSLLVEHEKKRLLALLKEKFPSAAVRDITFRIG